MGLVETFGLQQAADELGVHYQTAYQWVRRGELPAQQIGRHYVIAAEDLEAFRTVRNTPAPPASRAPREGFATALPRFCTALVAGDEAKVRRITADYAETGTSLVDIIEGLIAPALRHIGDSWHRGSLTVAEEHRASAIAERLLSDHLPRKRGRPRGHAVVTTPAGERHGLSALMATAALKDAGWKVHHLGPDMPTADIVDFARNNDITLVVLSTATDEGRQAAAVAIELLTDESITAITNEPGMGLAELIMTAEAVR